MSTGDWTWKRIDGQTSRMLVPGGWVLRTEHGERTGRASQKLIFIPWPANWPAAAMAKYLEEDAQS